MAGGNDGTAAVEGAERIMAGRDFGFRWVTHSLGTTAAHPSRHSHPDPTADAAIGNLMREEKKKKHPSRRQKRGSRRVPEGGTCSEGK